MTEPRRAAAATNQYLLDNQANEAEERLSALSAIFDPWTFRHMDDLGINGGWRCWEVGAGGSSVIEWMARRVGPDGRVLATDIDVSLARRSLEEGPWSRVVELRRHDVGLDEPPAEAFDLVHARLVLVHVAERDRALRSMTEVLRPGGWLLLEDADPALQPSSCIDSESPEADLANRLRNGFRSLMSDRGVDLSYGRKLPRLLRAAGLVDVAADAYFPVTTPECARLEMATTKLIRDRLIEGGLATAEEVDRHITNVSAGKLDVVQPPLITAWGRRS